MEGLIVKQPYADMIIDGQKTWELRSRAPPSHVIKAEIYLLSQTFVLGIIRITNYWRTTREVLNDIRNYPKHQVEDYLDSDLMVWEVEVMEKFDKPRKYVHPTGARVWVKNVSFSGHQTLLSSGFKVEHDEETR